MTKTTNSAANKPLAIVMGRNYAARLCMIRAAGGCGCDVVLIQTNRKATGDSKIDSKSVFVRECHFCPEPHKEELIKLLLSYQNEDRPRLLLPTDDYVASTIDANLDLLRPHFLMPHVNHSQGAMLRIMDKNHQKELASEVGMHTAKGWISNYENGQYSIPEGIIYPCFTKPQDSYMGQLKQYMIKCEDESELKSHLADIGKKYQRPILIEQYIHIEKEYAVLGVSFDDTSVIPAVIEMTSKRLGQTATGIIYPISRIPGLQEHLMAFMKETRLTGVFDIDLYESGGKVYFNELNTRLGASGFALTYTIQNLPELFINHLLGKNDKEFKPVKEFPEQSFASEKLLREMYYAGELSFREYKKRMDQVDILSLKYEGDMGPYREFARKDLVLPLWKIMRKILKK